MNSRALKNTARVVRAQIGYKRGRFTALSRVIDVTDVPGQHWKVNIYRTLRAGVIGTVDDIARRARHDHCLAAWVFFRDRSSRRKVIVQVIPLASTADADDRIATFEQRNLKVIDSVPAVGNTRVVTDLQLADVGHVPGIEYENLSGRLIGFNNKWMSSSVNNIVFSVSCSGPDGGWSWDEVLHLASLQRSKLQGGGQLSSSMKKHIRVGDAKFAVWLIVVAGCITLFFNSSVFSHNSLESTITGLSPGGIQSRGGADYASLGDLHFPSEITNFAPLSRAQSKKVNETYVGALYTAVTTQQIKLQSGVSEFFDEGSLTNPSLDVKNLPVFVIVFSGPKLATAAHVSSHISDVVFVINAIYGQVIDHYMFG